MDCFAEPVIGRRFAPIRWLAMTAIPSRRAVADRRLERQGGIPGKENPGVLRHLRYKRVDQRATFRLGGDRGTTRARLQSPPPPPVPARTNPAPPHHQPL